jgi:hypothetical protein
VITEQRFAFGSAARVAVRRRVGAAITVRRIAAFWARRRLPRAAAARHRHRLVRRRRGQNCGDRSECFCCY